LLFQNVSSGMVSGRVRQSELPDPTRNGILTMMLFTATFGKQAFADSGISTGAAVGEFVLLFSPMWRVWDALIIFTTHYFIDDLLQRLFLVW